MKTSTTPSLLALHATAIAAALADTAGSSELYVAWADGEAALAQAVEAAGLGAQADGSFVTISPGVNTNRDTRVLHAPGKGGPLCKVVDGIVYNLRSKKEAREIRDAERARNRFRAERYEAALSHVVDLLRAGIAIPYCAGLEGGVLYADTDPVSARGALRRLGLDMSEVRVSYTTHCRGVMSVPFSMEPTPSRRSVPARVRRLPASDRRAALEMFA